ncbi:hypothetical protein BRC86_02845 [Halobacteriales archaeon QS_3_64_16]|nr:MAG: hypothetical protein BRC86_02845 [Halobacteriales archaeon QS_3_64_16]
MVRNHRDEAIVALIDRDVERATDTYTRAAYGTLAGLENEGENRDLLGADARWAGHALSYLLLSAACYRVAGAPDRGAARCREGIALAGDLRDAVLTDPFDRACCVEFVADFGVVGGLEGGSTRGGVDATASGTEEGNDDRTGDANGDDYDRAIAAYEAVGNGSADPMSWATSPMAEAARRGSQQIARNTPHAFAWDDLHGSNPDSIAYLTHRPRCKRSQLPPAIEHATNEGYVHPPRGTTEHNNAAWRCPNCGHSEVNRIAGEVICLDCSVRLERA